MSTALAQVLPADATRQLYERHSSRIFGFCLSRLGSREEAEDAVQTTFLNVQRGLGRGVVPEYELAWLFKIAQNVCHNRHQSTRRRGRVEAAHDLDALQDVIASPDRSPAVSLGDLTQALGAIPTRQRKALLLREFQGYSYEEISSELGISVAAVETLLFRARRAVAQQLEQTGAASRKQRGAGAAASVVELFRWFFGGAAAPLKLAAVTAAAVATTAALSVSPGDKPAPVAPAIVEQSAVVPGSTVGPRNVARSTARPAVTQAVSEQNRGPVLADPTAPAVQASTSGAGAQPDASSSVVGPTKATAGSTVPVPELSTPEVTLPGITVPEVTVPGITVPAVTVPAVTVPPVVLPDLQLPTALDLPKLP